MEDFLTKTYFNNTVQDYLIALGIIIGSMVLIRIFKRTLLHRLYAWAEKTETSLDDFVVKGLERFALPILNFVSLYWGLSSLTLTDRVHRIIEVATAVVVTYFILRLVSTSVELLLQSYVRKQPGGEEKIKQLTAVMLLVNMLIWALGFLVLFDNLGYNVTTIIAGLGIGGIAIALAAQNILGDLFNYFVIFFDRPFEIGDFIVIDDKKGTVEYIGVKTTRLKSLSGEQLILSNSDLTKSRLHNFKRMTRRRIVFTVGVMYQTNAEQLREIPAIIKKAVEQHQPNVTLDRTHLVAFADSSIDFETVYFVENPDYNFYMDIHQAINLTLFDEFTKRNINFAFPSRTIYLMNEKGEANPGNKI